MKEDINMRTYEKPVTDILVLLPYTILGESDGNDPNRDNDDEEGGTMGNTGLFDDFGYSGNSGLWDE